MSALPAEVPPSGAVPAKTRTAKTRTAKTRTAETDAARTDAARTDAARTDAGPRGRSRTGGAQARPSVHPLFPSKRWVLPDGDCIFPGGGDRFSGQAEPRAQRAAQAPRPADAQRRPDAQRPSRPRVGIRVLTGPVGPKAGRVAGGGYIAPAAISQAPPAGPITSARHVTVLNRMASADRATGRPGGPGRRSGPGPPRGRDCRAASAAADQAGPHRRGHPGRAGSLWPVRGGSQRGPGERSRGGARQCHAGGRPARRHAVVDRPERRPERRRPGRRPADSAGQPSHEPGHHGRAAAVGATGLRAADGT